MIDCKSLSLKLFSVAVLSIPIESMAHDHDVFSHHQSNRYGYIIKDRNGLDITDVVLSERSPYCSSYVGNYFASADDFNLNQKNSSYMTVKINTEDCIIISNGIPNHTYDDADVGAFPNKVVPQYQIYAISKNPKQLAKPIPLSLRMDNAIMLNGVKVDILAAGCYGVGDGRVGCFDPKAKWRYNPAYEDSDFIMDTHHAHSQPDGTYHYHASPNALFKDNSSVESPVIGFAADGYPIYGSYIKNNGEIFEVKSSYQLKKGNRPDTPDSPGGKYTGEFVDDFQYVPGSGDLDECNGMEYEGSYGYYVTKGFPYIINCFKGVPNKSFMKKPPKRRF
ncbi:YHYH protein [Francisella sp. SYW-9]|uniref:YHYH protein n=1 Tax=Francisella sp. SYW-9 TaxID=2610888 RepID=UPI00123D4207|nr:YHYH protein [Francisella sp. SYW-9]